MSKFDRRLKQIEQSLQFDHSGHNLETSTCKRMLTEDGALTEVVTLDGIKGDLADDAVEEFVQRFPVELI